MERLYGKNLFVFLCLVISCPLMAQKKCGSGSAFGVVTDAISGNPLSHTMVALLGNSQDLLQTVYTDQQGRYGLDSTGKGTYTLRISSLGYADQLISFKNRHKKHNRVNRINVSLKEAPFDGVTYVIKKKRQEVQAGYPGDKHALNLQNEPGRLGRPYRWDNLSISSGGTSTDLNLNIFVDGIYTGLQARSASHAIDQVSCLGMSPISEILTVTLAPEAVYIFTR